MRQTNEPMTPHIEHKVHIRDLIRSFAKVDECFDNELQLREKPAPTLQRLNSKLEFLLSFPLHEAAAEANEDEGPLTLPQLQAIGNSLPADEQPERLNPFVLRETLRDKLYEFLLRMDHCTAEQLATRRIILPSRLELSLLHLQQLVVFMISECLEDFDKPLRSHPEPAL